MVPSIVILRGVFIKEKHPVRDPGVVHGCVYSLGDLFIFCILGGEKTVFEQSF